ncbi:hypothetical protein [Flavobacterium sp.]|uniref:hypothetical protein n=1 Tax=Flavobacterium sp. TaxID=239 RepID=UPI00404734B4
MNMDDELILMNLKQKKRDAFNNAKQRAIDKLVERYYTRGFQLQLQRGVCNDEYLNEAYQFCKKEEDIEKERQDKMIEEKGYKDKTDYTFITINPQNQYISPTELKEDIDKIVQKTKWINENDYAYVIEQRSSNPSEYSGVHCHLLVHTKDKPNNEVRRELKNKVKHLVDMNQVKNFDIGKNRKGPLSILPTADPTNRMKYMLDWKKDPDKHAKQIIDKEMRETFGLDTIYFSGEFFSQLIIGHQECQESTQDLYAEENEAQKYHNDIQKN